MIEQEKETFKNWQSVNCNLCGSNKFRKICSYGETQVVKCKDCSLVYRNPRLKEDVTLDFYSFGYYERYKKIEGRITEARITLFKKCLSTLEKKIKSKQKRLLDVGCGQGHFLKLAKDSGWQVQGLDLSKSACDYAKEKLGLDIRNKTLSEAGFQSNSFDVITLWNVLDHLIEPLCTLREINRILKPEGTLIIRVTNVNFHLLIHKIFSLLLFGLKNSKFRDPSVIVNYGFSSKTVKRILQKTGFHKIEVYNSPLSYGDPYQSFSRHNTGTINLIKNIYYFFSQIIFYLSIKNLFINSSLLVYAIKKDSNNRGD